MERIDIAAIRVDGEVWALPRPARHHVLIMAWCWSHYSPETGGGRIDEHEQGFLTTECRFVDRKEAAKIAIKAKQILPRYKKKPKSLTSEHLW